MSCNFPTADDSKSISELRTIHLETCAIQTAILDAREAGLRTATICNTAVTMSTAHWNAYQQYLGKCGTAGLTTDDKNLLELQADIIDCIESLGYSVKRVTNTATGNTFCWVIEW